MGEGQICHPLFETHEMKGQVVEWGCGSCGSKHINHMCLLVSDVSGSELGLRRERREFRTGERRQILKIKQNNHNFSKTVDPEKV